MLAALNTAERKRVDLHQFVAAHVGAALIGLLLSGLIALVMRRLWPALATPVFVAAFLGWTCSAVGRIARTYRTRILPAQSVAESAEELAFSWEDLRRRDRRAWLNFVESSGVILTSCFVVGSFMAAFAGLLAPQFLWTSFLVAQAFCLFVAVVAIVRGRR